MSEIIVHESKETVSVPLGTWERGGWEWASLMVKETALS